MLGVLAADSRTSDADGLAGRITTALGQAWAAIRTRHPELPPAIVLLASGTGRGRPRKWGHWGWSRWSVGDEVSGEVLIADELLGPDGGRDNLLPVELRVLETLLHEAAHALTTVRAIKDTSRQGRYHNARFKTVAEEVGLEARESSRLYGWKNTRMAEATRRNYQPVAAALREVLQGYHEIETRRRRRPKTTCRWIAARCGCGRTIRASRTTLEAASIKCGACEGVFEVA